MKSTSLLSLLTLLFIVTACGGSKKPSNSERVTKITEEEINYLVNNQDFDCDSVDGTRSCPKGIARLLILNPNNFEKSKVCSGFMVSSDRMVTNNHCVSSQTVCNNTRIIVYDGSSWRHHKTRCQSIVKTERDSFATTDDRHKIDYTVLEVRDPFVGPTIEISETSVSVGDVVSAWVVDHTGLDMTEANLTDARITEFKCTVESQSSSSSIWLKNCPLIYGNSGSAILNTSGKAVGVIWGASEPEVLATLPLYLRRSGSGKATATDMIYFRDWI